MSERLPCIKSAACAGHAANPEGHLATAAASGQGLTKNQKKKLKKKLKKAGAGSQTTDSGQQPDASHTDSDGSCDTGQFHPSCHLLQNCKQPVQQCGLIPKGHAVLHAVLICKAR